MFITHQVGIANFWISSNMNDAVLTKAILRTRLISIITYQLLRKEKIFTQITLFHQLDYHPMPDYHLQFPTTYHPPHTHPTMTYQHLALSESEAPPVSSNWRSHHLVVALHSVLKTVKTAAITKIFQRAIVFSKSVILFF